MKTFNALPEPSEHASQAAVCSWWSYVCKSYGLPEWALFSIPNGSILAGDAPRRAIQMAALKRTGLRPGVPDLFLAAASPRDTTARGLWIECKRKPNKPSPEQNEFIAYLRRAGYHCVVSYSALESQTAISAYLKKT